MGELAEAVLLNHPTWILAKMVDRMVSDSLVYRLQDADDRRKVLMFSSDCGKTLTQRPELAGAQSGSNRDIAESYGNKATAESKRLLCVLDREGQLCHFLSLQLHVMIHASLDARRPEPARSAFEMTRALADGVGERQSMRQDAGQTNQAPGKRKRHEP